MVGISAARAGCTLRPRSRVMSPPKISTMYSLGAPSQAGMGSRIHIGAAPGTTTNGNDPALGWEPGGEDGRLSGRDQEETDNLTELGNDGARVVAPGPDAELEHRDRVSADEQPGGGIGRYAPKFATCDPITD